MLPTQDRPTAFRARSALVIEETFGVRLLNSRKARGLTQEEAAAELRIGADTLGRWESGESSPRVSQLSEICTLYGVAPSWLIEGAKASSKQSDLLDQIDAQLQPVPAQTQGLFLIDMRAIRAILESKAIRDVSHLVHVIGTTAIASDILVAVHSGCRIGTNEQHRALERLVQRKLEELLSLKRKSAR